jgi:hypothetical protein
LAHVSRRMLCIVSNVISAILFISVKLRELWELAWLNIARCLHHTYTSISYHTVSIVWLHLNGVL